MKKSYVGLVHTALEHGQPVVGVRIISQSGSAPRTAGAWMLVLPDGSIKGTVGGGMAEAMAIKAATGMHDKIRAGESPSASIMHLSLDGVSDMDMICGGSLSMLLEPLRPGGRERVVFERAAWSENAGEPFVLVSRLLFQNHIYSSSNGNGKLASVYIDEKSDISDDHLDLDSDPSGIGKNFLPADILRAARRALADNSAPQLAGLGEERWLIEPYPVPSTLYLFGGGHVSLATAALASTVNFRSVVIDDRQEFANQERFPHSRSIALPDLTEETISEFLAKEAPGKRDAIVIMTRGHANDREALAASLLNSQAGYVGMIGSRTKRDKVYSDLRLQGIPDSRISEVHCPVGLFIMAQTPEEIAVSIIAELIRWRGSL
ncbi:XdhC family protein [Desulfovibrio sp. OttesenSCG-928-C06]|nr:XdhC family protein [Desulfovibrio sp. OttesenSCG-928-C06]